MVNPITPFTTLFADVIGVERLADIEEQFQYNVSTSQIKTTLVGNGTVTQDNEMIIITAGTDTTASAVAETRRIIRYRPGFEGYTLFTSIFETGGVPDSIQHCGAFTNNDGYYLGFSDTEFIVGRKIAGTRTEIRETTDGFNGDVRFSTIDTAKLNIYRIAWGWLGTGTVSFQVMLPDGEWILIHKMDLPNTLIRPSTSNPQLPICFRITKTDGSEEIVVKSGSWVGGINGTDTGAGDRFGSHNVSTTVTTEALVMNLQNVATFQSKTNRVVVEMINLSLATDGAKSVIWKVYKNLTIATPTWVNHDSVNSVMQIDTVGTPTITGEPELVFVMSKEEGKLFNTLNMGMILTPADTWTITAESANSNITLAAPRWKEQF